MRENKQKIPIFVITGFLGSGKTTLLNELLIQPIFANSAVIINEFGETSLDHYFVSSSSDEIIELANGCLCCTVRGQLIETLEMLLERNPQKIVIETSGLADPVPVLQALAANPIINGQISLSGLITVFDAVEGKARIEKHQEADRQLKLADIVCVSKLDEVDDKPNELAKSSTYIKSKNPHAQIIEKQELLADPATFLSSIKIQQHNKPEHDHHRAHHSDHITSLTLRHDKPIKRQKFEMFVDLLLSAHGEHVLRMKGLVNIAEFKGPMLLQSVASNLYEPQVLSQWPDDNHQTRIVIFLEGIETDFIQRLFDGFMDQPSIDTPDHQALTDNPLAISGVSDKKI